MDTIFERLYLPYLTALGYEPAPYLDRHKFCGHYFTMDPDVGKGDYWCYSAGNQFGIAIYELTMHSEKLMDYNGGPFLYLGTKGILSLGKQQRTVKTHADSIIGFVGTRSQYKFILNEDFKIRSIGLTMTEEFVGRILDRYDAISFEELTAALGRLQTGYMIPEISETLQQIQRFRPSEDLAEIYYESKLVEILSLVLQWDKTCSRKTKQHISAMDLERLEEVVAYLSHHFAQPLSINELCRRSCMSRSKLSDLFKQVYQSTITDYLHKLRLQRAKELLLNSDLKLAAIADEVGYKLHGSFSEVFKKHTGFTPYEYRKMNLQ